jgi:hypothetical protein
MLIEKSNDIEIRTRDLPACGIVPQPTTLPRFTSTRANHYLRNSDRRKINAPYSSVHMWIYTYCHVYGVTIDRVLIGKWIYWTLTDPSLQLIITVSVIHTLYSSLEHILKLSDNGLSFLWVPELSPCLSYRSCLLTKWTSKSKLIYRRQAPWDSRPEFF